MSDKHDNNGTTTLDSSLTPAVARATHQDSAERPGFIRRYRLPLTLAVVAVCLYAGSILYILYGRGQIA